MARSEYARSEFYEEGSDVDYSDGEEDTPPPRRSRSSSSAGLGGDDQAHIQSAQKAMARLHELSEASDWKKVLKHKKGVVVYQRREGKGPPVYKGENIIKGYSPSAVFAVVGSRKLWDDWYQDGSLVANLDDTSSLTYMSMKGIVGSSTRDLSLVEKVEGSQNGAIYFCSSSVESNKIPRVSGRVRANILLNGWVLEPVRDAGVLSTKASYFLHVNVKTIIPGAISGKYLARRPVCISKIDDYLQKHGAPAMAGVDPSEQQAGRAKSVRGDADSGIGVGSIASKRRSRRPSSIASSSRGAAVGGAGFLDAGLIEQDHKSAKELESAKARFVELREGGGDWSAIRDIQGGKMLTKKAKGGLPIVKSETRIEGVTTAQVVGTILSQSARRMWDKRWATSELLDHGNGFDHGVHLETLKGVFGRIKPRYLVVARGVEHENGSSDSGTVDIIATSTEHKASAPSGHEKANLKVEGWHIEAEGDGEVSVEHVNQTDLGGDRLDNVNERLAVFSIGQTPRTLRDFIDQYGYAPYFVRWQQGPAQLKKDEGDLTKGDVTFHVEGDGPKGNGEQKAWFQWSEKMYERGISLTIEPKDAATIAKVDGMERTLQFIWDKPKNVKITVTQYDSNGAEDVELNGRALDDTVAPPSGGGAAGGRKAAKRPKKAIAGAAAAGGKSKAADSDDDEKPKDKSGGGGSKVGAIAALPAAVAGATVAPVRGKTTEDGQRQMPPNAMLILSDNLAFTGPQLLSMLALMAISFAIAKLA